MTHSSPLIRRGEIYWAELNPTKGSEQSGQRPVLVIQNDVGNDYSPTTIIAPLTTKVYSKDYPTNAWIPKHTGGLKSDSTVLLSQIRTIDKSRLRERIGALPAHYVEKVNQAIRVSLEV